MYILEITGLNKFSLHILTFLISQNILRNLCCLNPCIIAWNISASRWNNSKAIGLMNCA